MTKGLIKLTECECISQDLIMENDVLRRISMCKGIFQDAIRERSKFIPEKIGSIPENVKRKIQRRKINKNNITPGTVNNS